MDGEFSVGGGSDGKVEDKSIQAWVERRRDFWQLNLTMIVHSRHQTLETLRHVNIVRNLRVEILVPFGPLPVLESTLQCI